MVPSIDAPTPLRAVAVPPVGTSSGGHVPVHDAEVHVTFPPASALSVYSVSPSDVTSAVPSSPTVLALTVTPPAPVELGGLLAPPDPAFVLLAHAASRSNRAAAAAVHVAIRRVLFI